MMGQRLWRSNNGFIQQEVDDTNVENAVVIVPAFSDVVTDNDFREEISGQCKWPEFLNSFILCRKRIGRLNVCFSSSGISDKVNLSGDS